MLQLYFFLLPAVQSSSQAFSLAHDRRRSSGQNKVSAEQNKRQREVSAQPALVGRQTFVAQFVVTVWRFHVTLLPLIINNEDWKQHWCSHCNWYSFIKKQETGCLQGANRSGAAEDTYSPSKEAQGGLGISQSNIHRPTRKK